MITVIRKHMVGNNSYLMWTFVIVVVGSLVAPIFIKQSSAGPWVLTVNGTTVGYNTFVRTATAQEKIFRQRSGGKSPVRMQDIYSKTFDILIYNELLDQTATQLGICVSPAYVTQRMGDFQFALPLLAQFDALSSFGWGSGVDVRMLRKCLTDKGSSMEDFETEAAQNIARELAQQIVFVAGYAPLFAQKEAFIQKDLAKTISVLTFPFSEFLKEAQAAGATKEELKTFFAKESARYKQDERRSGIIWEFTPEGFGISVTDEQVQAHYDAHKDTSFVEEPTKIRVRKIVLPANESAQAKVIKQELEQNPAAFADKARAVSIDKASAAKGGMIEPFARGTYDKDFERAAFLLPQDGAISDVITTADGLVIIQRVERINKVYKPLKKVQKDIHDLLAKKQFNDVFGDASKKIARSGDKEQLDAFVSSHSGHKVVHNGVTRNSASKEAKHLFGGKKDETLVFSDEGKAYLAIVTAVVSAHIPSLEKVEEQVHSDLFQERAVAKLADTLAQAKKESSSEPMNQLAKKYNARLSRLENFDARNTDAIASYRSKGLPVDSILLLEKAGSVVTAVNQDGYLARVEAIDQFNQADFVKAQPSLAQALGQQSMGQTLFGFIASVRKNATIKQNDALINPRGH